MNYVFTLGFPILLGAFCTAVAWRVSNRKQRMAFGVVLSIWMVGLWQYIVMQVHSEPTFLSVAWALTWS